MALFYCTTDQVCKFASILIGDTPLLLFRILEIQFSLFFSLTYWAEILHMALFYCTTDQVPMSSICVKFCGVMPLLELRILKINSFPLLSLSCFDIQCIELNFCIWLYFTVVRIKFEFRPCVNFCGSYAPFCTTNTWNTCTQFSVFFHSYALTYWAEIMHMALLYFTTVDV